jgi:hypothetical protein
MPTTVEKLSLKTVKNLPYKTLNRLINKAKKHLKTDDTWIKTCKEFDEDVDIIDFIPTKFGNLDVSAKTDHGVVILNWKLLCDGDFIKDYSYLIHEYTHYLQQTCGTKPTKGADDGDYLHNKFEQRGFQNQVVYIADNHGEDEAEEYVDELLEHHEKDGQEADKLKDILLEKVDANLGLNHLFIKYDR